MSEIERSREGERVEGESLGGVEGERHGERERVVDGERVVGSLEREIWRGIEAGRVGGRGRGVGGEV